MEGLWQRTADRIRDSLGQVGFETWIGPLNFLGMQGRTVTIEAPNRFFRDWVNDRYLELLRQSLSAEVGQTVDVKLTLGLAGGGALHESVRRLTPPAHPVVAAPSAPRDRHPQLNERYTCAGGVRRRTDSCKAPPPANPNKLSFLAEGAFGRLESRPVRNRPAIRKIDSRGAGRPRTASSPTSRSPRTCCAISFRRHIIGAF